MAGDQIIQHMSVWLWAGGLAATPLAVVVGCICRWRGLRPATRHMLWFAVLASFVTPVVGAMVWTPQWFRSDRLMAAADSMLKSVIVQGGGEHAATAPKPDAVAPSPRPTARAERRIDLNDRVALSLPGDFATPSTPERASKMPQRSAADRTLITSKVNEIPIEFSLLQKDLLELPRASRHVPERVISTKPERQVEPEPGTLIATAPAAAPNDATRPDPGIVDAHAWFARLIEVRDAIASVPPVPAELWLGGAAAIVGLRGWRTARARAWIRTAVPADPEVQSTVRTLSSAMGISRVPRAVFVERAISPMVWCGLRPTLILPSALWRTLDSDSRRAVLAHELAHVRRMDHVVCWIEAAIGAVYWWHPVVWWARQRLRDEAESSCDAWVTSLLPSSRRAYACALVVTGSYLSTRSVSRGPWLGVASGSSGRLARRITMVMTQKSAPGMSRIGALVAALVVTTGTFVMPSVACPQGKQEAARAEQASQAGAAVIVKVPAGQKEKFRVYAKQAAEYAKRAEQHAAHAAKSDCEEDQAKCEAACEAKCEAEHAETGHGGPDVSFFGEAPALEAMRAGQAPAPPVAPRGPRAPRIQGFAAPAAPVAPRAPRAAVVRVPRGQAAPSPVPAVVSLDDLKEGRSPRDYSMPQGRLEAFADFMSRGDVPVLIENAGDHMVIWGTDVEHEVFGQFFAIVGGGSESGASSPERRRSERGAFREYERVIRELEQAREAMEADIERTRERSNAVRERAERMRAINESIRSQVDESITAEVPEELDRAMLALSSQSSVLEAEYSGSEEHIRELERQIEAMEDHIEDLERKLEAAYDEDVDGDDGQEEAAADTAPVPAEGADWDAPAVPAEVEEVEEVGNADPA